MIQIWYRRRRRGEPEAFARLVELHAPRVGAVCWARLNSTGPIEDMTQETFLRAYRGLESLVDDERFPSWLVGIAHRACADWLKARARTEVSADDAVLDSEPGPDEPTAEHIEERDLLRAAVRRLPAIYRDTVVLFYFAGRSYRSIGASLGITEAAVNARLTRARSMLSERLRSIAEANNA